MTTSKALSNVFKLRDIVNVKDPRFGAKGDGVTDDSAAIQAAQAYLETLVGASYGGGALYFPSTGQSNTTYLIGTKLTVKKSAIRWIGDSMVGVMLQTTGTGVTILEVAATTVSDGVAHFSMQDLYLHGPGATSTVPGLIFNNAFRSSLERVAILGFDVGWQLKVTSGSGSYTNAASHCRFDACNTAAADIQKSSALCVLDTCQIGGTPIGVKVTDASDTRIVNCDIESCTTAGVDIDEVATTVTALNVGALISGCHFEGNTGRDIRLGNSNVVNGCTIVGNTFGSTALTKPVDAVKAASLVLVGNTAYNWTTSSLVTVGTVTGFTETGTIHSIAAAAIHTAGKIGLATYEGRAQGRKTANQDFTSATPASVTGLSFAIAASEEWQAQFNLNVGAGLGTTGIIIAVNGPSGATIDTAVSVVPTVVATTGTYFLQSQTLNGSIDFTTTTQPGGTNAGIRVSVWILNSTTAGTVQLMCGNSAATSTLTIRKGSHMLANRIA